MADIAAPSDADLTTDVFFFLFLTTLESVPAVAVSEETLFWPPPPVTFRRGEDDLDAGAEAL